MNRREFLENSSKLVILTPAAAAGLELLEGEAKAATDKYKAADHWFGMTIDLSKCIGCGNCVRACAKENDVPDGFFRTWVERYEITEDEPDKPHVTSPNGGKDGFPPSAATTLKTFYVPKLCNHCWDSPCTQVCPVGATFVSPDGVVMVDEKYCLGCRYCVQACPYGCRYIHPTKNTVDKCNLCYHRITKGQTTACCEACPTGCRTLADFKNPNDPAHEFIRKNRVQVLKPHMATRAKVYYKDLDGAVR